MEGKCCKCEEYGWADEPPLEVIYINPSNNKGYCVYHAPADAKRMNAISYSNIVFDRISAAIVKYKQGLPVVCELAGTIFPWSISFSKHYKTEIIPDLDISEAEFCEEVYFNDLTFCGNADFHWTTFRGAANFAKSVFHKEANFSEIHVYGQARFQNIKFFGDVTFFGSSFMADTHIYMSEFRGNTTFEHATFYRKLNACPSYFYLEVTFDGTKFHCTAEFSGSMFYDEARFTEVFSCDSSGVPTETTPNQHIFSMSDLTAGSLCHLVFSASDLPKFVFQRCRWPDRLGLDTHGTGDENNRLACEELYRAMKQRAAEEHDQPQVSRWHFREKLMALKRGGNGIFEAAMLWLYWATSGFGERAVRAGVWLLALVALSFLANSINEPWVWAELPGSAAAGYTMATIPFAKDIPGDGWVKVGRGFWQLLIAVQFTLFALAVRNRFRR